MSSRWTTSPGPSRRCGALAGVHSVEAHGQLLSVTAPGCPVSDLNQALVTAGVGVGAVRATRSLEEAFLGMVGQDDAGR